MTAQIGEFALSLAILAAMGAVLASIAAARFETDRLLTASKALLGSFAALLTIAVAEACFSRQPQFPQPHGFPSGTTVM